PLPVLRAAGQPAGVEDPVPHLVGNRGVGVRALVSLRGDGEVRIHRRAPRQLLRKDGTSRSPPSLGGRRCSVGGAPKSPRGRRARAAKPGGTPRDPTLS